MTRSQGVGTRLLQEAMSILRGIPSIRLDATPQGRPVYQRLGFEDEYELCRMQLAETTVADRPDDLSRVVTFKSRQTEELSVRPMKAEDLAAVGEADRRIFGADRHEILQWALQQSPEYAWIALSSAGLEGYCFGRRGFNFDQVGPVHSQSELVSQRLVAACLSSAKPGTRFIVDPLLHSPSWLEWLRLAGFVHQRPFTRMALGGNRHLASQRKCGQFLVQSLADVEWAEQRPAYSAGTARVMLRTFSWRDELFWCATRSKAANSSSNSIGLWR